MLYVYPCLADTQSNIFSIYSFKILSSICRDFKELDEILLAPVVDALRPVADISVESQVNCLAFTFLHHLRI